MKKPFSSLIAILVISVVTNPLAHAEDDPLEPVNRVTYAFNDFLDRYLVKPVAKTYEKVLPDYVEDGVSNFFDNLGEPLNIVNALLQGKVGDAGSDSLRLLVNSTVGILGLIDIGSRIGLEKHDEDFGQTLGKWGVGSGPYLVLPFLGPSTVRDTFARLPDSYLSYTREIDHDRTMLETFALEVVNVRAGLFEREKLLAGDRYTFIRDAYLQNREFKVTDGNSDDEFLEDDNEDDLLFDEDEEE